MKTLDLIGHALGEAKARRFAYPDHLSRQHILTWFSLFVCTLPVWLIVLVFVLFLGEIRCGTVASIVRISARETEK